MNRTFNPLDHPIMLASPRRLTALSGWHEHIPTAMLLVDLLKPLRLVELGTFLGDSYCAFCQAVLELALPTRCYAVDTWEGDPQTGFYSPTALDDLRAHHDPLYSGFSELIRSTFDEALSNFQDGTIDLLHIDGHHSYESVKHDFECWFPKLSTRGVVLLHDIEVRRDDFGVWRLWGELKPRYPNFELLHGYGLGILATGNDQPQEFSELLEAPEEEIRPIRSLLFDLGRRIDLEARAESLSAEVQEKKTMLDDKEVEVQTLSAHNQQLESKRVALEARVQDQQNQIEEAKLQQAALLAESESLEGQLRRIQSTRLWQIGGFYRSLQARLFARPRPKSGRTDPSRLSDPAGPTPVDPLSSLKETVDSLVPIDFVIVATPETVLRFGTSSRRVLDLRLETQANGQRIRSALGVIAQLEALRAAGAAFLVLSNADLAIVELMPKFRSYLARYTQTRSPLGGVVLDLRRPSASGGAGTLERLIDEFRARFQRDPVVLDWGTDLNLNAHFPEIAVFAPPVETNTLPYLDHSVDFVAVSQAIPEHLAEARRVAQSVVIAVRRLDGAGREPSHRAQTGTNLDIEWLQEPNADPLPSVSIIIPCHNNVDKTVTCLDALAATLPPEFDIEVVLVDDASTDGTAERLKEWQPHFSRLQIVTNPSNIGFVESSNRGASEATGNILVFLNNDTIPLAGWLPPMIQVLRDRKQAGAVGGKLVLPDGRLQEAGGVIFSDGSAANFGRGDPWLEAPLYNYVREVDYCSGALLATPRALFLEVGGFDERYSPAYYEDVDYSFKLRQRGYQVYYQPEAAIVHMEGSTAGTDLAVGPKRYQSINGLKFYEKWADILQRQPPRPDRIDRLNWYGLARHAEAGRVAEPGSER